METIDGFNPPKHCRVIGTFVKITSYAVIVKVFDMNSVTLVYYIFFYRLYGRTVCGSRADNKSACEQNCKAKCDGCCNIKCFCMETEFFKYKHKS